MATLVTVTNHRLGLSQGPIQGGQHKRQFQGVIQCQFSGVNVPPLFGNNAPPLFGNDAPLLFGNDAPPA
jgi:hypothetical protein